MIDDTEISFCLTASMGMGGGYVPMIVVNMFGNVTQVETRDICPPLRNQTGSCIPMIVVEEDDAEDIHGEEVL